MAAELDTKKLRESVETVMKDDRVSNVSMLGQGILALLDRLERAESQVAAVRQETLCEVANHDQVLGNCRCGQKLNEYEGEDITWPEHIRALQEPPASEPVRHVHTDACYGKIPETEGRGGYLRCGKVSGEPVNEEGGGR